MTLQKQREIEVENKEPFANDKLHRQGIATTLTQILKGIKQPFTISIEAPWGWGKTTFLKMWKKHLENEGFKVMLFNAWETDFLEDPALTITGELSGYLESAGVGFQKIATDLRKAGSKVVKSTLPLMSTVVSVDPNPIRKSLGSWLAKLIDTRIKNYDEGKLEISQFKQQLAKSVTKVSPDGKQLLIIVDELDRCRPTYAISFLERIKHLFNVDGITYILAIDAEQLTDTVKSVYGIQAGARAIAYLRRFIDYRFRLPDPETRDFCAFLLDSFGLSEFPPLQEETRKGNFLSDCTKLFVLKGLGLREIEQCFTEIKLALVSFERFSYNYLDLVPIMVVLKNDDYSLYQRVSKERAWLSDLIVWAGRPGLNEPLSEVMYLLEAIHSLYAMEAEEGRNQRNRIHTNSITENPPFGRWTKISKRLDELSRETTWNPLKSVIEQINLLNEIKPKAMSSKT